MSEETKENPQEQSRNHNQELGIRGEQAAQAFLRSQGYDILETNWKCRFGEVDIIARSEDALHFVEVKTRSSGDFGFPAEAVTPEKRQRYERMAILYLMECKVVDMALSFDIISIVRTGEDRAALRMHKNVFAG